MSSPQRYEAALDWRKASRSSSTGSECVEVAALSDGTAVRDSKNPAGAMLAFSRREWAAFAGAVRSGEHDL